MSEDFVVIIPARLASTRLPQKALREIAGRPMILHVAERAMTSGARAVHVATDADAIAGVCAAAGVSVVMTRDDHDSGSERLAEACSRLRLADSAIVVNVQGDEPLLPPALIRQVAGLLADSPGAAMASLFHRITDPAEVFDPNVVKVVCDDSGRAMYFSRAPIPWDRGTFAQYAGTGAPSEHFRHIGLYAYRAGFLRRYVTLTRAPLERLEALEQLRALHHGETVMMAEACTLPGPGVDTLQDLERVRRIVAGLEQQQ
jgi:3-deoxy-manno-octulosonate cytidylyltransferase (CMP-KDO synthetase)